MAEPSSRLRAASYARTASNNDGGRSAVHHQIRRSGELAAQLGIAFAERYVDGGVSDTKRGPELNRLMEAAQGRYIDVLLVASVDRLSRSAAGAAGALDELRSAGVRVVSADRRLDTSLAAPPHDRVVTALLATARRSRP